MSPQLKRTVLITGCSNASLGSALALAFHHAGWRVFATARNPTKLSDLVAQNIETLPLDTLSPTSLSTAVSTVRTLTGGSLDALINNAGAGYNMPLLDIDPAQAKAIFDLNVWSVVDVTKAFLPLLLKSTYPYGPLVANNTSVSSTIAGTMPFSGVYNASKAAASSVTETMRQELGILGIRVVNLVTGSVESRFVENLAAPPKLPADSVYNVAKEEAEKILSGVQYEGGMKQEEWARAVVAELGKKSPAHWVWKGAFAGMVRMGNHLPVGWLDGELKKVSGLGEVERKIQEKGGRGTIARKLE